MQPLNSVTNRTAAAAPDAVCPVAEITGPLSRVAYIITGNRELVQVTFPLTGAKLASPPRTSRVSLQDKAAQRFDVIN